MPILADGPCIHARRHMAERRNFTDFVKILATCNGPAGAASAAAELLVGISPLMLDETPGVPGQLALMPHYFAPQQKSTENLLHMRKTHGQSGPAD